MLREPVPNDQQTLQTKPTEKTVFFGEEEGGAGCHQWRGSNSPDKTPTGVFRVSIHTEFPVPAPACLFEWQFIYDRIPAGSFLEKQEILVNTGDRAVETNGSTVESILGRTQMPSVRKELKKRERQFVDSE